ncbi:MAG: hypothetical protein ABR920_13005 [Terriglobales bacterium]
MAALKRIALILVVLGALIVSACGGKYASTWIAPAIPQTAVLSASPAYGETGSDVESANVIHASNGKYYWYYHYSDNVRYRISVLTSDTPEGPWTRSPLNPILSQSAPGMWDDHSVACATVKEIGGKFYMFYCGQNSTGPTWSVGLANADAPEGPWTKQGEIVPNFGYVTSVVHHDGLYWMYSEYPIVSQPSPWSYMLNGTPVEWDYGLVSVATSSTPEGPWIISQVVLGLSANPWENGGSGGGGFVFASEGRYLMLYSATPANAVRADLKDSIGYAYSPDGVNFTRSRHNPILSDPVISLMNVNVLAENAKIYVYYTRQVDGTYSLGQVTLDSLPAN